MGADPSVVADDDVSAREDERVGSRGEKFNYRETVAADKG